MPPRSGGLTLDSCYRYRVLIYESDRADLGDESQVLHLGSPNLLIIGYRTATAFRKASVTACAMPGAARFPVRSGTGYSSDGRPVRSEDTTSRIAWIEAGASAPVMIEVWVAAGSTRWELFVERAGNRSCASSQPACCPDLSRDDDERPVAETR